MKRIGQLDKQDKEEINTRLKYILGFDSNPSEDWFRQNATSALVQKIYGHLTEAEKDATLESLFDAIEEKLE